MAAETMTTSLSQYETAVTQAIAEAQDRDLVRRIWRKDATVWKAEDEHQKIIRNSLGWLSVPGKMAAVADELTAFADRFAAPDSNT